MAVGISNWPYSSQKQFKLLYVPTKELKKLNAAPVILEQQHWINLAV
jgi:hypothetical protein